MEHAEGQGHASGEGSATSDETSGNASTVDGDENACGLSDDDSDECSDEDQEHPAGGIAHAFPFSALLPREPLIDIDQGIATPE
ncbi:hypothetical protein [Streptosporangium sp. KLBMP 9127]|nr:hypothetical protein [Streptosporangium sp. KLBMP 9127]